MKIKLFVATILAFSLWSCNKTNLKEMSGLWESVDYFIEENGEPIDQNMAFRFDSLGNYSVDYGSSQEEGKYWIDYDKLYTQEEGQKEKSVRLREIKEDTLIIEMNRSGQIEVLILARQD